MQVQEVIKMGGKVLNVEQVIRSNGQFFLEDIMVDMHNIRAQEKLHSLISL